MKQKMRRQNVEKGVNEEQNKQEKVVNGNNDGVGVCGKAVDMSVTNSDTDCIRQ